MPVVVSPVGATSCIGYDERINYDSIAMPYDGICTELPFNYIGIRSSEARQAEDERRRRKELFNISVTSQLMAEPSLPEDTVRIAEESDPMLVEILGFAIKNLSDESEYLLEVMAEIMADEEMTVSSETVVDSGTKGCDTEILTEEHYHHDPRDEDE